MNLRHNKTLITEKPGIGKTTLVRRIVERLPMDSMAGFYTAEIRFIEVTKDNRDELIHRILLL